ncbi:MAG: nucleotidyltransferase family protein [Caulobacteraceae bacterium]
MRALRLSRRLNLPDWMIASGAIYQGLWNALICKPPDFGLKDYDLFYFDAGDLSWEAEDAAIRRAHAVLPSDLRERIEIRNQARVHLWFEQKFGEPYPPLSFSAQALEHFVAPAFALGARLEKDGRIQLFAPFGLEDAFAMILRPNPRRPLSSAFRRVSEAVRARWPEVRVVT